MVQGGVDTETAILVSTAVSGGSLRGLIEDVIGQYGLKRIIVGIERVAMDFPLPCPSGEGRRLSPEELACMRLGHCAPVFFSDALCAKYFTCLSGGKLHFVLFDDEETLRCKERLARRLGVETVVEIYPYCG